MQGEGYAVPVQRRRTKLPPEPVVPRKLREPELDATEAGFHAWTDGSLANMIQDCQVMRVGVMQDAAAFVDFMRTAYPYDSHWSEIKSDEVNQAIRACAKSAVHVVDEVIFRPVVSVNASLSSIALGVFSKDEADKAHAALVEMRLAMAHLLLGILLRPRVRNNPLLRLAAPGSVDERNSDLASPAEALFYVRNVYLAQFSQRAHLWAARDDDWARAAYLLEHPNKRFETAEQNRKYDTARSEGELAIRGFKDLTTAWAHECRLWHSVHFDEALRDGAALVHTSPNLFLTDRSTPSTAEANGVEELFKRMHWALPGHLPPEYGDTPNGGSGTKAMGYRLTLAHCLLGGSGFIPTILAAAAAGEIPWAVHAPLKRARTVPGLRSVTLNDVEGKSEAHVRLGLGLAKWLDSPDPPSASSTTDPQLLPSVLRRELDRISSDFLLPEYPPPAPETEENGEYGPPADDLNLKTYLRRLRPNHATALAPAALLSRLLGLVTHIPALEALTAHPPPETRVQQLDREAIRVMLIALLTNDMLKTILGRLADPAGASELASLDAYALSGGRESQLVSTAYFAFLAKSEERIPEWLRRGMREMRRAVASGNYGPIDDWMADDGGEPTHLPGIRHVTIAMDVVALMSRFGLYAHLFKQYHQDWRDATREAAPTEGMFGYFLNFARSAFTMGRGEANAPTADQIDNFFSTTRMYDLDVVPSVYRALGHFVVGAAAFAHLFVLCGIPLELENVRKHCIDASLYGGIPSEHVFATWRKGDKLAKILGASPYPAPGPGPAIQVIRELSLIKRTRREGWAAAAPPDVAKWMARLELWIVQSAFVDAAFNDREQARGGSFYRLFMGLLNGLPVWDHENALAFKHYVRHVLLSKPAV